MRLQSSLVESNFYSNSLSFGAMREGGGQVSRALETIGEIQLPLIDY